MKRQLSVLIYYKADIIIISLNVTKAKQERSKQVEQKTPNKINKKEN
jgi:hypothetical protein